MQPASITRNHDLWDLVGILNVHSVFIRQLDARKTDVAVIDDHGDGRQGLALTRAGKAMTRIELELGTMFSACQDTPLLVQKLSWVSVQSRALMRTGIFETEEIVCFARDNNGPSLDGACLIETRQHKPSDPTLIDLEGCAYGE